MTVLVMLLLALGGLVYRIVDVQATPDRRILEEVAIALDEITVPAPRGTVVDPQTAGPLPCRCRPRPSFPIPASSKTRTEPPRPFPKFLGSNPPYCLESCRARARSRYVVRQIDPEVGEQVSDLGIDGVRVISEPRREHPNGDCSSLAAVGRRQHRPCGDERHRGDPRRPPVGHSRSHDEGGGNRRHHHSRRLPGGDRADRGTRHHRHPGPQHPVPGRVDAARRRGRGRRGLRGGPGLASRHRGDSRDGQRGPGIRRHRQLHPAQSGRYLDLRARLGLQAGDRSRGAVERGGVGARCDRRAVAPHHLGASLRGLTDPWGREVDSHGDSDPVVEHRNDQNGSTGRRGAAAPDDPDLRPRCPHCAPLQGRIAGNRASAEPLERTSACPTWRSARGWQ